MLSSLIKKKISEDKLTNIFVNSMLQLVEEGFPELVEIVKNDNCFVTRPSIDAADSDKFMWLVLSANMSFIPQHFEAYQDMRIVDSIYRKLSRAFDVDLEVLKRVISKYQNFCNSKNHPSKNILYGLSKGFFYKYELAPYQEEYFKNMGCPNPIFLKNLNELMSHFLFDWQYYQDKFKITE
jgi:hypothetical protein